MALGDDILIECIEQSGCYQYENVNLDDLPNDKRVAIILAKELLSLRPDLKTKNSDICYIEKIILDNGRETFGLPSNSLSSILSQPAYDDSSIWTYSLKENKLLGMLYKGTGTGWVRV